MTASRDPAKLADAFFAAIMRGDVEEAIARTHPEARAMQNFVGRETNARELLRSLRGLLDSIDHFAYENPRRVVGADAIAQQHDVRMRRKDGREVVLDVCIILRFDANGLVIRLDEYLDPTAATRAMA